MAVVINGSGTVTGLAVGGLPDGIVDAGTLATNSVDSAELIDGAVDDSHMASISGRRNILINGDMRVAQYAANNTAINTYGPCDRWRTYGGGMGFTVSQQSSSDYESGYCLRFHRTASNSQTNNTGMGQGIETLNSRGLAGKTVTLSFKAKCGANFSSTDTTLMSRINGGEGTNDNPFGMTNTNGGSQNNILTTSVQTFSFSFAMPSDKTQVTVLFDYTPTGTAGANDWFEIGDVQLELGSTATDFEHRHYGEELALCQRYYEYIDQVAWAGDVTNGYARVYPVPLKVVKRTTPTITTSSIGTSGTSSSLATWYNNGRSLQLYSNGTTNSPAGTINFNVAIDAEL